MTAGTHSRRRFLVRSTALGAVAALAARGARAGEEPAQTPAPAPEPLRCAVIGVGKRGGALLQTLLELDNVQVVALADTYDVWRNRALAWCKQKNGETTDYVEYDRLLKKEKLDAVFIATPPHTLAPAALEALDRAARWEVEENLRVVTDWERARGFERA